MPEEKPQRVVVYTEQELEIFLTGDRRAIDGLMLRSLNGISAALLEHTQDQDQMMKELAELGGMEEIRMRAEWVNAQIERQKIRNRMMEKVATSNLATVSIAFLGYCFYIFRDSLVMWFQRKGG